MHIDMTRQLGAPERLEVFPLTTIAPILAILLAAAAISAAISAFVTLRLAGAG